jgi:putative ABC transport system permease protein
MYVLLRTNVTPLSLSQAATQAVWEGDPEQSTFNIVTMEQRVANTIWRRRLSGTLFLIFAGLALLLAAIGIYGVMSYSVSKRTREMGIRMALGAESSRILRMIIGEALMLFAAGASVGLFLAIVLTRIVRGLLYQVSPADPMTFVIALVLLCIVAVAAASIPALRASRVDPMMALRQE